MLFERLQNADKQLELPKWWRKGDTLRFAYTCSLDPKITYTVKNGLIVKDDRTTSRIIGVNQISKIDANHLRIYSKKFENFV